MNNSMIPFNKPYMTGKELNYIRDAHNKCHLSGDGEYTKKCNTIIEKYSGCTKALLTHSCTAALEMAALLLDIKPGDEVIMPSYTFVSTANAFVLRGGIPVFVDIKEETLNINEQLIESAITKKTKAIVPVHYGGIACEMDAIIELAKTNKIKVIEDAAQGMMASYKGNALGSIGNLGAYSFHETKNVIAGEGGALLINDASFSSRAEVIREKGTDRSKYFRGEVDKYTWQEAGSSFLPGEIIAAFLLAQLEEAESITRKRLEYWEYYHTMIEPLEYSGKLRRPVIPEGCIHNAHMYYVLLAKDINRQSILDMFKKHNINVISHYIPLHSSPGGMKYGHIHGDMDVTNNVADRIIRLPLWLGITKSMQDEIINLLKII